MATKKSVFLSDSTTQWITATTGDIQSGKNPLWSESINATFEQIRYLIKTSIPDLTSAEWEIILNTYTGCYMTGHGVPARIASDMMDDMGEISLDAVEKLYPEKAALIRKVHAMSQTEQLAILYFVQIFWLNKWDDCKDFEEVKKIIIEKLKGN